MKTRTYYKIFAYALLMLAACNPPESAIPAPSAQEYPDKKPKTTEKPNPEKPEKEPESPEKPDPENPDKKPKTTEKPNPEALDTGIPVSKIHWDSSKEIPLVIEYSDARNWMNRIPDNTSLANLSIPGTHDSGSLHDPPLFSDSAKNQDKTYREQLDMGVRFLDIRNNNYEDELLVYHGVVYQKHKFDHVLEEVDKFLADNPSETIIMGIKKEGADTGSTRSFEQTLMWYMKESHAEERWYTGTTIPDLGDVRGKIVLLRRFAADTIQGIDTNNWQGNAPPRIELRTGSIRIQDHYSVGDAEEKWRRILPMFLEAHKGDRDTLYLNLMSAHTKDWFGIPKISPISSRVNPTMLHLLKRFGTGRLGVLIADYINKDLALRIVNANFIESDAAEFSEAFERFCQGQSLDLDKRIFCTD